MAEASNQTAAFAAYNAAERVAFAQAVNFALLYLRPYQDQPMTDTQWVELVNYLYPFVKFYRDQSSRAARNYYDSARLNHLATESLDLDQIATGKATPISRFNIFLANFKPNWLIQAMEPVRKRFQRETTSDGALTEAAGIIGKQALNGGRRTMLRAVEKDPVVQGWARVQGGGESCAFCWMLISRGPVFGSAGGAGLRATDSYAVELFRQWEDTGDAATLDALMTRWHDNCDCRVVPVFDKAKDWPGKDDYLAASKLWGETTGNADGREKYRAFRRALGDGVKGPGSPALPVPKPKDNPLPQAA